MGIQRQRRRRSAAVAGALAISVDDKQVTRAEASDRIVVFVFIAGATQAIRIDLQARVKRPSLNFHAG